MLATLLISLSTAVAQAGPTDVNTALQAVTLSEGKAADSLYQVLVNTPLEEAGYWDVAPFGPDLALVPAEGPLRAQLKLPDGRGLVATSVRVNGPAWEAGVREQDVLLALGDEPLAKAEDLDDRLKKTGEKPATLTLLRKGKTVRLGVQPRVRVVLGPEAKKGSEFWIGVSLAEVDATLRAQLDIPAGQGLTVTEVTAGSPAAKAGLAANDVILSCDGKAPKDAQALAETVQARGEKPIKVLYLRGGDRAEVEVTPAKRPAPTASVARLVRPYHLNYNVVRPAQLTGSSTLNATVYPELFVTRSVDTKAATPAADAAAPADRLDAISAEIKTLAKAVEDLRKAIEAKK